MRFVLAFLFFLLTPAAQAASVIQLQSTSGSNSENIEFTDNISSSVAENNIHIYRSGINSYSFTFTPPQDEVLEKGAYLNAQNPMDWLSDKPGISIYNSGGCSYAGNGEFYIYEIATAASVLPKLALDFVYNCNSGSTVSTVRGKIRINSDIPLSYPYPLAVAKTGQRPKEGGEISLDANRSFSTASTIQTYAWEQVSGPSISIANPNNPSTSALLPTGIALGGEDAVLKLTVTDETGNISTTTLPIHIPSKSDPETYFKLESAVGDYIGQGKTWAYDPSNSTFTMSGNYDNGVSIQINNSSWWWAEFAAPADIQLEQGKYDYADRFPFQNTGAAGLNIWGDGRSCNMLYGSFDVVQLVRDSGYPVSFKAHFEQHCENPDAPVLKGTVAVNAVPDSVPVADAGADIEVYEKQVVNLNGSGSYDSDGHLAQVLWTTETSGLQINSADETRAYFTAPTLNNRETSRTVYASLLVTDDQGYKAVDNVKIRILANNKAPVAIADAASLPVGSSVEIFPLTNDKDSDGQLLVDSITITKAPSHGSAIVKSNGSILYMHTGLYAGTDSLTYTIMDNDGAVSAPATIKITLDPQEELPPITLNLRTFLQGAYESSTGLMRDNLRQLALLPLSQPYNQSSIAYEGNETTTAEILGLEGNDAPVDWVIVELRDPDAPLEVVSRQAALLQRDGDLANPADNSTPLLIRNMPAGQFYVSIQHRNHLVVMSATPLTLDGSDNSVDFTQSSTSVAGVNSRLESASGIALQWAGDINSNGGIIASGPGNDILPILSNILMQPDNPLANSNFVLKGYYPSDLNLDGLTVFAGAKNDIDMLLGNVLLHPANTSFASNYIIRDAFTQQ